ncbi:MAG: S24 family peptidase [Geminicoccaceae bacterium]
MLTHAQVWQGVDRLAGANGLSPSGLARRAGLDPTTFNKSKRATKDGRPRWPSTESLAKILEATTTNLGDFVALIDGNVRGAQPYLQCLRTGELGAENFDPAGFPTGDGWDRVEIPVFDDATTYALEIDDDRFEPVFRAGDLVVVSAEASVRRMDRVVVMPRTKGPMEIGCLSRRTATKISLLPLRGGDQEMSFKVGDVAWVGRIVWVSQ